MTLRVAVLGAGSRGAEVYGAWFRRHPGRTRLVAVADRSARRARVLAAPTGAATYGDWRELVADLDTLALDAAVVALPDREHVEPAVALLARGLPLLLEKPAAVDAAGLERLAAAAARHDGRVAVGHVLRFTPFWRTVAALVTSGALGRLLTIDLRENIGFWHFAHSYVRGSWRSAARSSPMVLAKTCHDLDLVRWLAGQAPDTVRSVGSLSHFTPRHAPDGAPEFCVQGCPVQDSCPWFAPRYYVEALREVHGMPVALLSDDTSPAGRSDALRHSDYGRCVYRCDNDVVDHQQTLMGFPSGLTATLTASAFTGENTRTVALTGTGGQVVGHMSRGLLEVDLFSPTGALPHLPDARVESQGLRPPMGHRAVVLRTGPAGLGAGDHRGHAGGDEGLVEAFVTALESGRWGEELDLATALDGHRMAFAAEADRARGDGPRPC